MKWITHSTRSLYESPWVGIDLVDVEVPGGDRFEHHVVRARPACGVVNLDPERGILMLWRHRFITNTWGYELPAGVIEPHESPDDCAKRETLEETGWEPHHIEIISQYFPSNGLSDQQFHIGIGSRVAYVGEPTDPSESERVEWVSFADVRNHIATGTILDGLSLTGLSVSSMLGYWSPNI